MTPAKYFTPYRIVAYLLIIFCVLHTAGGMLGHFTLGKGQAMESSDEQSIIAETQAFAETWNRGDAKTAASFFAADGMRVGAFGDVQRGHAEIEAAYDKLLHHTMPGAIAKQERGSVRMLSPDLAVWQGGLEIVPMGGGSSLKGHVVQVMKKVEGRWLVLEAHPKFFPPPPAPR